MKEIYRAYKYRIYPNKAQKELINKTFGCCRFVYNFCRAEQKKQEDMWQLVKEMQQQGYCFNDYKSKFFNRFENIKFITELKKTYTWLKEADNTALQSSVENLAKAYYKYYKKQGGKPKFKSKKNPVQSYITKYNKTNSGGTIRVIGNYIRIAKVGSLKFRDKSRPMGQIVNAVISKENNKYYISLNCKNVLVQEFEKTNKNIGIDLGICDFAILSNGIKISNKKFYENQEENLDRLQRQLSRKQIGSNRWRKAKIKVGKLQTHIANQRKDFLQKLTTNIVKQFDTICIEDLEVSKMKETDKNERNKRISDLGFYEFRRQLQYKCEWYGKILSVINRYYPSSQICNCCGHRSEKKDETIREWICENCGTKLDRDTNASINILKEGLRMLTV